MHQVSVRRGEEKTPVLKRLSSLFLAGGVVLLDQLTKAIAETSLVPGISQPVLDPFFHLTLVRNPGIAFGLFQNVGSLLFVIITASILALGLVGVRLGNSPSMTPYGIGLILGGAVGNWIDRVRGGAVIDFLDFRIWPVFNLADTAITVGVGLFLLDFFRSRRRVS